MTPYSPYRGMPQLSWDVTCLGDNVLIRSAAYPAAAKVKQRAYPVKLLRYWFMHHFLCIEQRMRHQPLNVCEVGIDRGQMRHFVNAIAHLMPRDHCPVATWTGVDCEVRRAELANSGYTALVETDIESSDTWFDASCDVILLLHVLEHLLDPEKALAMMVQRMKPGSVLIGGSPSIPHVFVSTRERQLRRRDNTKTHGHVSKWSTCRIKRFARTNGVVLEFLSGSFMCRSSGSWLEGNRWWLRFNLLFGALFPWWPGEIYWVIRKPMTQ